MQLELGKRIRGLRHRDGRTQEDLAEAIGVTSQAVSRWEANGGYPDMEMIPAIANYFGITIDELFGYENDRERKIDAIIEKIDSFRVKSRMDDDWVDECVSILREGLAEFPGNKKLLITLAETLSEAGWRRHSELVYYDEEGFIRHNYDVHRKNPYWQESIKICEHLVASTIDSTISMRAITVLVLLYRNFGEIEKAVAYAKRMPELKYCRELMLAAAADGKEEAKYIGEFLLEAASNFKKQLIYGLIANKHHFESDMPINKIKGVIALFDLICDDGNFGLSNDDLIQLYLYLSGLQWERGYHDEAFESLDKALYHAKELEKLLGKPEHGYTAPLVRFVADPLPEVEIESTTALLPDYWPVWYVPDYGEVEKEMKSDPRWAEWVAKTKA